MKRTILILFVAFFATTVMADNSITLNCFYKPLVKLPVTDPCSVTVTTSRTELLEDCHGNGHIITVTGTATKLGNDCTLAFVAANSAASANATSNMAAERERVWENVGCKHSTLVE
jgi:hypothetical protein